MININIPERCEFILMKLHSAGFESYIVGGALRNFFLERPITDWDVATSASPEKIRTVFAGQRLFDLKHDTVTLVMKGKNFEITTFRGNRNCILEDLELRDFTINALAYDHVKKEFIDNHGGLTDIKLKLVKAVGDPEARFMEDPLRLLRAVRIATELGFRIEKRTYEGIAELSHLIEKVSPERVQAELIKILKCKKPSLAFHVLRKTGLLKYILPELLEGYRVRQNHYHKHTILKHTLLCVDCVEPSDILRLTALFHDIAKPRVRKKIDGVWRFYGHEDAGTQLTMDILARLKFSRKMIEDVGILVRNHMISYNPEWSDAAIRRLIKRVGIHLIPDLLLIRRADIKAHGKEEHLSGYFIEDFEKRVSRELDSPFFKKHMKLNINGEIIKNVLGISEGPYIGKIIKELESNILEHPELNTEKDLISLVLSFSNADNFSNKYPNDKKNDNG